MQTNFVDSEAAVEPRAPQPVSWLEPVSTRYKRTRAAIAVGIALTLVALLAWAQVRAREADWAAVVWKLAIGAAGAWVGYAYLRMKTVRKFRTVEVTLTRGERFKAAAPWLGLGFGGVAITTAMYLNFREPDGLISILLFSPFALIGVLVYALRRKQTVPTPEAAKMKAHFEAPSVATEPAKPAPWEEKLEEFVLLKLVRYPAAAGLLWLAYELADVEKPKWILVIAVVVGALFAAHELFLWLLLAGIVIGVLTLGFNLVAALPVSAAIVVGAIIIAAAMKK